MRTFTAAILSLGLVAALSSPAAAQGPGRGFGARMGSYSGLLANESVQKELKLDDKQIEKSKELDEKIGEERREKFQSLQDVEQSERFAKMQEMTHELNATAMKKAAEFLKPEQVDRLKQIAYQVRGYTAFGDPEVAKKLNLSDSQKKDIVEIMRESGQEIRSIFQDNQDDREAAMKKIEELRKQTIAKVEGKLNDEQKKTWKGMQGAPFAIKYE